MRVVALFRVSTEKQASEGASLDAQQRTYRDLAAKEGWTTVAEFRGHESATQAASDRRVLQQVLACIRDREPDAVYVHEQSRLTRGDELEVAVLMRELKERGTKIIVRGVVRDLSLLDDRFTVSIQGVMDRTESERIKERMMRGKREKARQGKKNSGPAPFGYRNPRKDEQGHGTLQIVEEEAVVVRKVFSLAATRKGYNTIAAELNELGFPSPSGRATKGWGRSSVRNILNNVAYTGVQATNVWVQKKPSARSEGRARQFVLNLNNPKAIIVEGAHPAIIDRATWDAVHHRAKLVPAKTPRMLTGLLYVNGERYGGDTDHGRSCYRGPRSKTGLPWLATAMVDDGVWDAFASMATGPEFVERLLNQARSPNEAAIVGMEIEHLTGQIRKHQSRLERLFNMRADDEIEKDEFLRKRDVERSTVARLEAELVQQRARAAVLDQGNILRIVKAVQTLLAGRTRLTTNQKSEVIRSLVGRVNLKVVPTGAKFARDCAGRVTGSGGAAWRIEGVTFELARPGDAPAPDAARDELAEVGA